MVTPMKELYDLGEMPPLGQVPTHMHAQVVRRERYGDPEQAYQVERVEVPPIGPIEEEDLSAEEMDDIFSLRIGPGKTDKDKTTIQYLGQGPYDDCQIVAMCNALRWHGLPSPEHPSEEWERLVDIGHARHGPVIATEEVVAHLGLVRREAKIYEGDLPLLLTVWNPEVGSALHDVLVIAWTLKGPTVVNYRGAAGPLIETLRSRRSERSSR